MYTYIKRDVPLYYVELQEPLQKENYNNLGESYDDFLNNKWVLLSDDQVAFKLSNPNAKISEVWNMKLEKDDREKEIIQ